MQSVRPSRNNQNSSQSLNEEKEDNQSLQNCGQVKEARNGEGIKSRNIKIYKDLLPQGDKESLLHKDRESWNCGRRKLASESCHLGGHNFCLNNSAEAERKWSTMAPTFPFPTTFPEMQESPCAAAFGHQPLEAGADPGSVGTGAESPAHPCSQGAQAVIERPAGSSSGDYSVV
ncbi:hypothetical protein P7K49_008482 [Saguinus oedipus]|uniref:Uncharacterized protein n=1 Tax=Saguinus oedipus TaxID=9490 RepID=A0ABQ9VYK7_SAGOE|nr:hypothetical protein P7K49_008482 [Saguinus oedipus]